MSFPAVSLIPSALGQSASASSVPGQTGPPVPTDLLAALAAVVDPRHRRGVRHPLLAVLGIAVCAVLGGARSFTAISEWAADLPRGGCLTLGILRRACDWLAATSPAGQPGAAGRRHIALDGKTARGARRPDGRAQHLFAAIDTDTAITLGQCPVDGKTHEISVFGPLLDRIDITGALISADALHTQHRHAEYLRGRGAHYLFTVKANQPSLHAQLAALPRQGAAIVAPSVDTESEPSSIGTSQVSVHPGTQAPTALLPRDHTGVGPRTPLTRDGVAALTRGFGASPHELVQHTGAPDSDGH